MFHLTTEGWAIYIVLTLIILTACAYVGYTATNRRGKLLIPSLMWGFIISGLLLLAFNGFASKHEDIRCKISVYNVEGDLIKECDGRSVSYCEDRVVFYDENGQRHVIYYSTGTVIIDEIGE